MKIKKVMIAGGGNLGSQIAWQIASQGFKVNVYDAFEEGLEMCKTFHKGYANLFLKQRGATQKQIEDTMNRLHYTTDLSEAVKDVDIVNESIPEVVELKIKFYTELGKIAPEKTIFTTNSSSTLPSQYANESGRPSKLLAMHFATGVWDNNIAEIMGHQGTDSDIYDEVVEFAKAIGMIPIKIKKEYPGYVLNALLIPLLVATIDLLMNGISDHESIDKTWTVGVKSFGPCALMDQIGMKTVYSVNESLAIVHNDDAFKKRATWIKENFIDKGKLGVATGEGFYKYPNPKYEEPDFFKK